ncbi:hypothetical protein E2986_13366 [Frieseomelitta varia]|uniref:Uncharacterized protein n=1 Tax=Frieseomelitta varia TaxID=561572 RepID=A0A833RXW7_9HYME|nr:hypothetical protein E2986_13366 [Frieseomelitta varia]
MCIESTLALRRTRTRTRVIHLVAFSKLLRLITITCIESKIYGNLPPNVKNALLTIAGIVAWNDKWLLPAAWCMRR